MVRRKGVYAPVEPEKTNGAGNGDVSGLKLEQQRESYYVNGEATSFLTNEELNYSTVLNRSKNGDKCGLGDCFSPRFIQPLASKQVFLVVFCLTCILQGMFYTYFASVLTTLEKLFQIRSKTTGIIMSATEIGQIVGSLLLSYYGGQGHRPKWIGWGTVLFGLASLFCSLPHFLFGTNVETAQNASFSGFRFDDSELLCHSDKGNKTSLEVCEASVSSFFHLGQTTLTVLGIFFISLLGVGLGQTAVFTLGIPYIDDNVANKESPTYFAVTIGVRILGPVFGFVLGAICTSLYVDIFAEPEITAKDPRWIGAWWLGMLLVGVLMLITSLAMFAFPKRLPGNEQRKSLALANVDQVAKGPSLKDFPRAFRRLLRNDILVLRTASSVLHILPIAGLYTFLPKFLESQFRLTAHVANMISGIGGILVMGVGILISGIFIRRVKPSARSIAAWIAFTALLYSGGMMILMVTGCEMNDFSGLEQTGIFAKQLTNQCNETCSCDMSKFSPVCSSDGKTYFSACHAGCEEMIFNSNGKSTYYSNCICTGNSTGTATKGYCSLNCPNFYWYLGIFSFFVLLHSTSEVGAMLLTLRCVEPREKAMALGLVHFAIGLFGNVPCPIIYGAVVDSACLVWDYTCGQQGACWLYDVDSFRFFFHGITAFLMLLALCVDFGMKTKTRSYMLRVVT
ncbi:solute carrier organic anion transporter family member 74D-like isoform X2 [Artemia franciscana]|uniref:solute carrier organic anion transporter family member 74D-like isoform X2 n=1 Tax=Artemia franciscana TaxID=6661 RepID=UPI0032DAAD89